MRTARIRAAGASTAAVKLQLETAFPKYSMRNQEFLSTAPQPTGFLSGFVQPIRDQKYENHDETKQGYFLVSKFCSAWIPSKPVITVTHQLIREPFLPRDRSSRKAGPKGQAGSVQ